MLWVDISIIWKQMVGEKSMCEASKAFSHVHKSKDVPKNVGWGKPYTWPLLSRPFWLKRCVSFVCCLSLMDDVTLHTCDLFQNFWNLNHLKPTQPGILKSLLPTYKPSPTVPDWNCSLPWHIYPIFSRRANPIWTVHKSFPGVWYSKSSGFCATQPGLVVQKCTTQAMGPERPGAWKKMVT